MTDPAPAHRDFVDEDDEIDYWKAEVVWLRAEREEWRIAYHALKAEVADLRAWKAEAQQRGAEMARRGLEIAAERDALREALEEYAGRAELQAIWHSCRACERDATIARAALKGDGQGGGPTLGESPDDARTGRGKPPPQSPSAWTVEDPPPGCSLRARHDPHAPMSKALGCSPPAHRRR